MYSFYIVTVLQKDLILVLVKQIPLVQVLCLVSIAKMSPV